MRKFLAGALLLTMLSCTKDNSNQISLFKDDGHRKPTIALVPVIDNSESELPWNVSEEFTSAISNRLQSRGNLLLADNFEMVDLLKNIDDSCEPFSTELDWAPKVFKEKDFVVFLELVDHYLHTHPNQRIAQMEENRESFLDLTMRVRLIDLRGDQPRVVLQELISHSHAIPKLFANVDYSERHWGKTTFHLTPVGLAHIALIREVSRRLEDYISIAATN